MQRCLGYSLRSKSENKETLEHCELAGRRTILRAEKPVQGDKVGS